MRYFLLLGNILYFRWNTNYYYDHPYEPSTEPCCKQLIWLTAILLSNRKPAFDIFGRSTLKTTLLINSYKRLRLANPNVFILYKQMFSLLSWFCKVIVTWYFYEDCISLTNSVQGTLTNEVYSMLLSFFQVF